MEWDYVWIVYNILLTTKNSASFSICCVAISPQVFTELDLNELESKWTDEANLHPQEDDPAAMGAGGANLDLFYNAASQEEDMPAMMEEGHDGHVGDGMVDMEAAKTVADGGAGGGGMTMMQQ